MVLVVGLLILAALLWDARTRLATAEDRAMDARLHGLDLAARQEAHRELLGQIVAELRSQGREVGR
jgi:hypothetical protein